MKRKILLIFIGYLNSIGVLAILLTIMYSPNISFEYKITPITILLGILFYLHTYICKLTGVFEE